MITLDLSGIVDTFASDTLTRTRWPAATYLAGVATQPAATDTTITGMVEPITGLSPGRVLEQLDEGQRKRARYTLHTTADVRTVNRKTAERADHLVYLGITYEAIELSAWQGQGNFSRLVLLELGSE
jgi:hypothetical protein